MAPTEFFNVYKQIWQCKIHNTGSNTIDVEFDISSSKSILKRENRLLKAEGWNSGVADLFPVSATNFMCDLG